VLIKEFHLSAGPQLTPRYNVAPTQDVSIIRNDPRKRRELSQVRWGLVPSWAKEVSIGSRMINARSETVAEKPSFRAAFKRRRCLIPADGYYEWSHEGSKKQPHWIRMNDHRPFAMAGLWERWKNPADGVAIETCTILTTNSNELTRKLHDRMPVILNPHDFDMWLDVEFEQRDFLESLLVPYPSDDMKVDRVNPFVNNARNEGPQCIEVQRELF
jgi:putative SOS response-associated peptidase YedK